MSDSRLNIQIGSKEGVGVVTIVFVVLLVIKLLHPQALSWFWVFSPFIFGFGIFLVILIVGLIIWMVFM